MFIILLIGCITAKLFIPLTEDQIKDQKSELVGSMPQSEIEEGADPFLMSVQENQKSPENDSKDANNKESSKSKESELAERSNKTAEEKNDNTTVSGDKSESNNSSSLSQGDNKEKNELDSLLETNILEEQKALEPSKLKADPISKKDEKSEDAFWTEVSVNGENRSVLVRIKQVTIVEKMGGKSTIANTKSSIPTSSVHSSVKNVTSNSIYSTISNVVNSISGNTTTKNATDQFPFLKIQLPALSKIFKNMDSSSISIFSSSSSEKPGLFSSLFYGPGTTTSSLVANITSTKTKATTKRTETVNTIISHITPKTIHTTATISATSISQGISVSIKGKDNVMNTKEKEKSTIAVNNKPVQSIVTMPTTTETSKSKEKAVPSTYINENVITRVLTAMSSVSSVTRTEKGQKKSESKSLTRTAVSASTKTKSERSTSFSAHKSTSISISTQSAFTTSGEPSSLGNVFDILKNMPGSSKHSTNSTFIEGKFSFPKDPKLEKKVFKLSGYISG